MSTISKTANHATDEVMAAASQVMETVLGRLGLQRRSVRGPLAWFAAGAAVAGIAVLALTPVTGKNLRQRVTRFFGDEAKEIVSAARTAERKVEGAVKSEIAQPKSMPNGAKPAEVKRGA